MKRLLFLLGTAAGAAFMASPSQASEWGCEVLLCASSSNPSWRGVPACHPPMYKLIRAMKKPGFSWPTCPEAGTGRPGYEAQEDCPEGTTTSYQSEDGVRFLSGRGVRYCTRYETVNRGDFWRNRRDDSGESYVMRVVDGKYVYSKKVTTRAPMRSDPYYFDIKDQTKGTTTRHYFNLRK